MGFACWLKGHELVEYPRRLKDQPSVWVIPPNWSQDAVNKFRVGLKKELSEKSAPVVGLRLVCQKCGTVKK